MRVLIAEDESRLADSLKRGLAEEGYVVDIAPNGTDALFLGQSSAFDLFILDVMLPGMDGIEVCSKLRAAKVGAPILLLTARDSVDMKVQGLDAGADDYLTKPFAFAELLARLRALTRRKRGEVAMTLQVADLVLDPLTRKVSRSGADITLTAKEYALLECLMRHPDQVFSRAILSEKCWDETFDTFTNVIDVYINYLRSKIDKNFEPKLICTVRGAGYVLRTPPGKKE